MKSMSTHVFTFGYDHVLPDGTPGVHAAVAVDAPAGSDHRAIFMAWLGSNRFSSEYYSMDEFANALMRDTKIRFWITVEEACEHCQFPTSDCRCLIEDGAS